MIEIREAIYDDIPALAQAHVQADWETYSALFGSEAYKIDLGDSAHRWRRALQQGETLLVASDGSQIVGLGHAYENKIGALYLLQSHRRRGIGKALLLRLLMALNERGVAEARLAVVPANLNAIRFYKSLGAYPVGRSINSSAHGVTEELVFAISTIPIR
jgi:ribosomal protein S18 acetylase RimI-like enzyme